MIRQKLREVLAYSSRTTEATSLQRTFVPAHLKSANIDPTRTHEIDISSSTLVIDRDIFKPKFRKNMLGRLSSKFDEESEEEILPTDATEYEDYQADTEILSSKVVPEIIEEESVTVIVPQIITNPVPSTKEISGIPRRYTYDEEDSFNKFVNIETELEGGDSQNIEVITSNDNDRIDVEYKEEPSTQIKVPQAPLYPLYPNIDLTTLPFQNSKQTTPTIPSLEVGK